MKNTLTRVVDYKMFGSVPNIVYERLVLKLVQIFLVLSGCCKGRGTKLQIL